MNHRIKNRYIILIREIFLDIQSIKDILFPYLFQRLPAFIKVIFY